MKNSPGGATDVGLRLGGDPSLPRRFHYSRHRPPRRCGSCGTVAPALTCAQSLVSFSLGGTPRALTTRCCRWWRGRRRWRRRSGRQQRSSTGENIGAKWEEAKAGVGSRWLERCLHRSSDRLPAAEVPCKNAAARQVQGAGRRRRTPHSTPNGRAKEYSGVEPSDPRGWGSNRR